MRLLVVGLLAGIVLGGTATGYAVTKSRPITIRPESGLAFQGLDFGCYYSRSDPNKTEVGPLLDCGRVSTSHGSSNCVGRRLRISRFHIIVWNACNGPVTQTRFNRSP